MAMTMAEVTAFVRTLSDVTVGLRWNHPTWMVNERGFAWERPFSKADLARFGDTPPPRGDILAVITPGLAGKDALLAMALPGFFTIPHFNGYAGVLIELRAARKRDVKMAIEAAWQTAAALPPPKRRKR